MHTFTRTALLSSLVLSATSTVAAQGSSNSIPSVVVTVENAQPGRGVFLTPPWIGMHDGSFDSYDGGMPASVPLGGNEIEAMAEDGNNGPLTATFEALLPNAPQLAGLAGPFGPLGPGDRAAVTLNVDPTADRYFSYASMVIPSNDTFIANGSPLAHEVFDMNGKFVAQGFTVSGDETNDAGTEVNDEIASNVAFLAQAGPNIGTTENATVMTPAPGFMAPGTLSYPDGILNYPVFANGDFNDADDRLLSVTFRYVDLGGRIRFESDLSADQEVQPDTVSSAGFARARVRARDGVELRVLVVAQDLSGPITAAHLHLGSAGTNGNVVVDLGGGINGGGNVVGFNATAADLVGPLSGAAFLDLLNAVAAGNVYINLHTAQYPDGEVRGQIVFED